MKKSSSCRFAVSAFAALLLTACSSGHSTDSGMNTEARLHVAEVAENSGDSDTALSMYAAAAKNDPKAVDAQVRYARALAAAGRTEHAKQALLTALKATPRNAELQRALASVEIVAGDFQQAAGRFAQITAARPKDVDALIDQGVALDLSGHSGNARVLYARALTLRPDDMTATNDMAMSLLLDGRFQEARNLLMPFVDRDETPQRLKNNLAIAYAGTGDLAAARAAARGAYTDAQLVDVISALHDRQHSVDAKGSSAPPL
jgi:Flp pilus assembly protein TadD